MQDLELSIESEARTEQLGRVLGACLPAGATICLSGTLGAGKTRLVQAVAEACGMSRDRVVSPTFTLCNEYPGTPDITHMDWYRIADEDELAELGIEEYFGSPSLTFIEWANRFPGSLPPERLDITIELTGQFTRNVRFRASGRSLEAALDRLRHQWTAPK